MESKADKFAPLDPALNVRPPEVRNIYLMGIGGVAMTALAGLLKSEGFNVSGSDRDLYPPMSDVLASLDVTVFNGYRPENLAPAPDLAIIGNVVTSRFSEIERLAELKTPYLSLPQAVREFFLAGRRSLVVSGCHGKTTTTALTAHLLSQTGLEPGFLIGGSAANFPQAFERGQGEWFVIEGDEYDDAFFSKQPKFIHYQPEMAILTSVEYDHADIYPDLESLKDAYRKLIELLPPQGLLIVNGDDPLARELAAGARSRTAFYGLGENNDWRILNPSPSGLNLEFELIGPLGFYSSLTMPRPGLYNALNAAAAVVAALEAGCQARLLAPALADFKGVRRRQELAGAYGGITVIDDFAHHPTAVGQTLAGLAGAFPGRRLVAVFEPRSNTSRRGVFQHDYPAVLAKANLVLLREVPQPEKTPEDDRLDLLALAAELRSLGPEVHTFPGPEEGLALLRAELKPGDVVVFMSNGGFDGLKDRLINYLAEKYPEARPC